MDRVIQDCHTIWHLAWKKQTSRFEVKIVITTDHDLVLEIDFANPLKEINDLIDVPTITYIAGV